LNPRRGLTTITLWRSPQYLPGCPSSWPTSPAHPWRTSTCRLIDFDPAQPGGLAGLEPTVEDWIRTGVAADPYAHQLVLKVAFGRSGAMNLRGLDPAGAPEGLAVEIASTA
jgi:hypothetical protein